jgi:GNAT superfamily N-acetyltransferase
MWMDPVVRRAGLGRRLLQAVIDWASQRGAVRLDTSVSTEASTAHALYLSEGFVATGKTEPLASNPTLTEVFLSRALQP